MIAKWEYTLDVRQEGGIETLYVTRERLGGGNPVVRTAPVDRSRPRDLIKVLNELFPERLA